MNTDHPASSPSGDDRSASPGKATPDTSDSRSSRVQASNEDGPRGTVQEQQAANSSRDQRTGGNRDVVDTPDEEDGRIDYGIGPETVLKAVNAANNMITVVDMQEEDQPLIFINDYFCQHLGYDREEIVGLNCRFLQYDGDGNRDDDQEELDTMRSALAAGEFCRVQLRNYKANGEPFINELYLSPIIDADGSLTHYVGVQNDVTQRALLQNELRTQTGRLKTAFDAIPSMVGLVRWKNDQWEHVLISSRLAQYLDTTEAEGVGKSFQQIGYPPELARQLEELCSQDRENCDDSVIQRLRIRLEIEGEVRTLDIRSTCVKADASQLTIDGELLIGREDLDIGESDIDLWAYVAEDVTDWLRTNAELEHVQQAYVDVQTTEQQRIARDLHDGTAQEILALSLRVKALQNKYTRNGLEPDAVKGLVKELQTIQQIADRANSGMRQSIRGLLPGELETVGLTQSVAQLVNEANQALCGGPDEEPCCRLVIESRVTPRSYNQSMHLYRIVAESLANARRHADPGTVIVRIGSDSGEDVSQPGELAFIEIADDGVGMDPAAAEEKTLGFGLRSMAIRAVRANGKLSIQTEPGRGTVVRCDFRLTNEQDNAPEDENRIEFSPFDVNTAQQYDDTNESDTGLEGCSDFSIG